MYLIEFVTEAYIHFSVRKTQIGYKETKKEAEEFCKLETEKLKGTYNENRVNKYYQFRKLELL